MNRGPLLIFLIIILLFLSVGLHPALVKAADGGKRVIVLVLDSINMADLRHAKTPNIARLIAVGATGLLNTATHSGSACNAAHISIGAGARASGGDGLEPALEIGEEWEGVAAGKVYQRRMGMTPQASIVHLGMAEMVTANAKLGATVRPGALGQALSDAGHTCCLLGNSDIPGKIRRPGAGIVIDYLGVVKEGSIGLELQRKNPLAPYGLETNERALLHAFRKTADSSVVVIEWGDTLRAAGYSGFLLPEMAVAARRHAIERADAFLGELLQYVDLEETLLILISPTPSLGAYRLGDRLTPIIMAGMNTTPGLLSSATTRRAGLVANIDLAPTILDVFQLSAPPTMQGRPMRVTRGDNGLESLAAKGELFQRNFLFRPLVIKTYIVFIVVVLATSAAAIYRPGWWNSPLSHFLVAVAALPLVLLMLPLLSLKRLGTSLVAISIVTIVAVKLVFQGQKDPQPFIILALLTVGALWLDLLTGQSLLLTSLLGYCPISGARYYGMGNEYMGLYLGAGLIGWSGLAEGIKRAGKRLPPPFLIIPGFLLLLIFVAWPHLGANFGGAIATMWGGGATIIYLRKGSLYKGKFLLWGLLGVLLLTSLSLGDYILAGDGASHLGRTVALTVGAGVRELSLLIGRKLGMNLKLLKYSWWSLILLAVLILFMMLSHRPPRTLRDLALSFPILWAGLVGSGVGAFVAFLVNDSGVVAGATALIFPVTTLLFLLVQAAGDS